jgi:hypothetical protein
MLAVGSTLQPESWFLAIGPIADDETKPLPYSGTG